MNSIPEIDRHGHKNRIMIFDFQYHEKADLWVDHHYNDAFKSPLYTQKIQYNRSAKSAASLVDRYVSDLFNLELSDVNMVNMIDSCSFPDIDFAFTSREPLMILRAYLENKSETNRIVEAIARFGVSSALEVLNITGAYVKNLYRKAKSVRSKIEKYGNISVLRQRYPYENPRYAEFLIPGIKYSVRISRGGYVQISYNAWHDSPNEIHLGKYIRGSKFFNRGGGHPNVASGQVNDIDLFLDQFSLEVNEVEKYAVDKENDEFEKKAEEMVKTGEAKNIDEAREKVDEK